MSANRVFRSLAVLPVFVSVAFGQSASAPVDGVEWGPFQKHAGRLLTALDAAKFPLPATERKALESLLTLVPSDADQAVEKFQKLLDPYCLVVVSINPESRVKAARGAAPAALQREREDVFLVKVVNEAGVTSGLKISGPQVRDAGQTDGKGWLDARIEFADPKAKELLGTKLEYVLLRLTAREAGKREATLKFDVGQGTQDLGFRAELPVLFAVGR